MRYVAFDAPGLKLSKLAFGCAPVMGKVGRAAALRAMQIAGDAGVTHFDVARSYGYGEAERVLGAFAAGRRDRITLATKFGIKASRGAGVLRYVKPAVRSITQRLPFTRSLVRAASGQTLVRGHYDLPSAQASFEESLRELNTDYVDLLFIHEPSPDDVLSDELLSYLDRLQSAGRIRAWGIATRREWTSAVFERLGARPQVLQYEQSAAQAAPVTAAVQRKSAILHSPFGGPGALSRVREIVARGAPGMASLRDASDAELGRFLLEYALYASGGNAVLCSMFNPDHIRRNVQAVDAPRYEAEVAAFDARRHDTLQASAATAARP